ncbi:MAG: 3-phosphoserine/phosphohydroxythreonine transaminase [Candidatus Dasytiphilus stammeri]
MVDIYNFSAGPAMIPKEVMDKVKEDLVSLKGLGNSILEISHRSKEFLQVVEESEQDIRDLMKIPLEYKVLFCHGGARAQFSAVPLNLLSHPNNYADYVDSGYWSFRAAQEAQKYCNVNMIDVKTIVDGHHSIIPLSKWNISDKSYYVHYCPNETINGIALHEEPHLKDKIMVADCSSVILSRPIDINNYGVIYAGTQKNIGTAGLAVIIIHEDLLENARREVPSILNYKLQAQNNSMFNTPPTFSWYITGLVLKWLKKQGGLEIISQRNQQKADLLYKNLDQSNFYINDVSAKYRSVMNVTFKLSNSKLENIFFQKADLLGLRMLKGHQSVGGIRASLYNAMPIAGVKKLIEYMKYFELKYG